MLPDRRAHAIRAEFGQTAREQLTCGCHVHVEVADDEEGVRILDHLRPWTAILLALSGNSPSWQGTHTGYASYRSQVWGRWPTAGPTAPFGDAAGYRAVIDGLLRSGTILDEGMVYFDARLSSRYPTVEVRVADVCLDAERRGAAGRPGARLADTTSDDRRPTAHGAPPGSDVACGAVGPDRRPGRSRCPARRSPQRTPSARSSTTSGTRSTANGDLDWVEQQLTTVLRRGNGAIEQLGWRAEGADDDEVVRRAVDRTAT